MDKVLIPGGLVDDKELDVLVKQIATVKGADAILEKQFIVTSDSPALLAALRALFGDHTIAREKKEKRNVERVQKRSKLVQEGWKGNGNGGKPKVENEAAADPGAKPEPKRGPHVNSIQILGVDEKISRFELDKRLRENTIMIGAELHSPKHGNMKVISTENGLALMNESGEVIQ